MIHENIELTGSFVISGSFVLPNHPISSSVNALTGSIYNDTTDNVVKVYNGSEWVTVGEQTGPAPPGVDIEYLAVAGGGGGGEGYYGGGGGAGGYLSSSLSSVSSGSTFTITIGGGGSAGSSQSSDAGNGVDSSIAGSSITTITAVGGGGGASRESDPGASGGSGGGASRPGYSGGSGTVGQGNDGGTLPASKYGAGGGGAGEEGPIPPGLYTETPQNDSIGCPGGAGLYSKITGTSTPYAGGGGSGARSTYSSNGIGGGVGGGGAGGAYTTGTSGTSNTGGGGGGGGNSGNNGGAGGSGVAIFAYPSASINAAGGIVGDAGNGRKYNQFNSSGAFKVGATTDFSIVTDSLRIHLDAGDFASRGTSTWTDLSGNSENATMTGTDLGSNYYYTYGNGDYGAITYNSNIQLSLGSSIEIWLKHANTSGGQLPTWMRNVGGICIGNVISGANVGYWTFAKYITNPNSWINVKSSTVVDTNWHHLVGVVEPSAIKIYVDGALEGTTSDSNAVTTAYTYDQHVGGYAPDTATYSYYGDIGQYRMYNKALSAAEVLQNYEATKTNFV